MGQITLTHILLILLNIFIFAIFVRIGSVLTRMKDNQRIKNDYNSSHYKQQIEILQTQNEILEELSSNIQQLKSDVEDMKYVSDIFYEYKLPNKKERELLDRIAIDNEVFEGISKAQKKDTKNINSDLE